MSATSPLPQPRQFLGQTAQPIPVPDRGTHIPASYVANPHDDPEGTVVRDGALPLLGASGQPFTVSEVAEERRWAINEDGTLMKQVDFHARIADVRLEFYAMLRSQGRDAKFEGNIQLEPVPTVARYVSLRVDPLNNAKLIEMGFDPDATAGAKPAMLADGSGENAVPRIDALVEAYHNPNLRKSLKRAEVLEVEAHIGVEGNPGPTAIASELEAITADFTAGKLTDTEYADKVRGLTGATAPERAADPAPKKKPEVEMLDARCGKPCKGLRGQLAHQRKCKKCKEIEGG